MSFAHLVCAVNPGAVNRLLMNYNPERNGLWTSKDNKGETGLSHVYCVLLYRGWSHDDYHVYF